MITKITLPEVEKIIGRNFTYNNNYFLGWTDYEDTNIIINLLKNCNKILELGTYKGHTTENIANFTDCTELTTVDIVKELHNKIPKFQSHELLSSKYSGMYAKNKKINKKLKTSDEFFSSCNEKFDGIFVDASHDYEEVIKDSLNSINFVNTGGIIVWHDVYNFDNSCSKCASEPNNDGVVKALKDMPYEFFKVGNSWIAFLIKQ